LAGITDVINDDVINAKIAGLAEHLVCLGPDAGDPLLMAIEAEAVSHRAEPEKACRDARKFGRSAPRDRRRFRIKIAR
jgi:hypothetical protein